MFKHFASVGAYTLLSRLTGFLSGVVTAQILGAGKLADAFFLAARIPNNFRAIFGEGAFNAAYGPVYTHINTSEGPDAAKNFSSQIFTLLLLAQIVMLVLGEIFTPQLVQLFARGYADDTEKFELAVTMTRITFPYLAMIVLVTLHSATLNAHNHFAAAAFAPTLLNLFVILFLFMAFAFPNAGIAASVGIVVSGAAQLALVVYAARRANILERLRWPNWGPELKHFFLTLMPAVIASAGVQIAIFVDTNLASFLPDGGQSWINYADRLYQLPIGVIGIAAGTVLLPEMSRKIAAGDTIAAYRAQSHTMALTVALTMPFLVAFLAIPNLIVEAAFMRGHFNTTDAQQSANVLWAYSTGLIAIVLIRSAVASFQARKDTRTPMYISLFAIGVNVACKFAFIRLFDVWGLALATALGAVINFVLLVTWAWRRGWIGLERSFFEACAASINAGLWLYVTVLWLDEPLDDLMSSLGHWSHIIHLLIVASVGAVVYFAVLLFQMRLLGWRNRHSYANEG